MVKLEKQFTGLSLKRGKDPEVWLSELEDLCMRLEVIDLAITNNQFMIHILNNHTSDYDLQIALMEKRVWRDKKKPLTVEEIKAKLSF
jgi:hypothetical protein